MGLFDRVERGLERAVHGAFAKAFKAEVQPVEIASAMRRAMDDRAAVIGHGRTFVPNIFTIELAPTDFDRLTDYADPLTDELVASAQEHAESQRYQPGGPIQVQFVAKEDLETGVFRVRPATAKGTAAPTSTPAAAAPGAPGAPGAFAGPPAAPGTTPSPDGVAGNPSVAVPPGADDWAPGTAAAVPSAQGPRQEPVAASRPRAQQAQRPWLEIDGDHYPLLSALTVLGRDNTADVILDDPGISRRHTEVRVTSDGPHLVTSIRDLGSTNGTFVNGERITSQRLTDGDRVNVGRTAMTYRAGRR